MPAHRWAPEHKGLTISPNDSQSSNIFSPNCLLMDHMNFYSKVCDLSKSQLCAGGETKSGACQGDSGSGLVVSILYLYLLFVEVALWSVVLLCCPDIQFRIDFNSCR